jgi:hypothetical protein
VAAPKGPRRDGADCDIADDAGNATVCDVARAAGAAIAVVSRHPQQARTLSDLRALAARVY